MKGQEFAAAADVSAMLESVRGHNMAKGSLEAAVWDAEAKQKGVPLWKVLGGTREEIASGVSIGIKAVAGRPGRRGEEGTRRRLSAHQDQNQARQGFGTGQAASPGLSQDQIDGGCQFRLPIRKTGRC